MVPILQLTLKLSFLIVSFEDITELSSELVRFYSVKLGSDSLCEFEKFDALELIESGHLEERSILYTVLDEMTWRGAKRYFFKPEGAASALPRITALQADKNLHDFGLRLYCVWINENAVVLLNGGIKTTHNPLQCPNVKDHFRRALRIAQKIDRALKDDLIAFSKNGVRVDESFEFDI